MGFSIFGMASGAYRRGKKATPGKAEIQVRQAALAQVRRSEQTDAAVGDHLRRPTERERIIAADQRGVYDHRSPFFRYLLQVYGWLRYEGNHVPVSKEERMRMSLGDRLEAFDWSRVTFPAGKKMLKGIVGVHSSLTDGMSTVAQYAASARQNHLSFLVFTEPLPLMNREKWETLKSECVKVSAADFNAYAGLEYLDETGATFLEFDMNEFPLDKWITKDGRINDPPGYHFQNGRECSVALCLGDKHKQDTRIDPWHTS